MFPSIISRNTKLSRRMDENSSLNIPPPTYRFTIFVQRHSKDLNYRIDTYDPDEPTKSIRYDDAQLDIRSSPSYSKFKAPYNVVCNKTYLKSTKKYVRQLRREIQRIINNQSTAREATYFVRHMAITSLWPPYYNRRELEVTSHQFYSLSPKEQLRFDHIMSHDFSYM